MEIVKDIETCISWQCPVCKEDTDQVMDYKAIEEYDGAVIKVTCPHDIDMSDDQSGICGNKYLVDLRG